jgi:hypothetical protein
VQLHIKCLVEESRKDFLVEEFDLLRDLHLLRALCAWDLNRRVLRELDGYLVEVGEDHHRALVSHDKVHQGSDQFAGCELVGLKVHSYSIYKLGNSPQPLVSLLRELPEVAVVGLSQLVQIVLVSIRVPLERVPVKHGD